MKKLTMSAIVSAAFLAVGLVSAQDAATRKNETSTVQVKVEPKPVAPAKPVAPVEPPKATPKEAAKAIEKVAVPLPLIRLMPARVVMPAMPAQVKVKINVKGNVNVNALAPAPARANLEPLTKQMIQQLRPLFRAELRFLTSACEPSAAERREIALEGGRELKEAAKKMAEVQQAMQNGGWRGGAIPDPPQLLRVRLLNAARAKLSPDRFARYNSELEKRDKDQREAIAMNLVAHMDQLLILSHDQRAKLVDSFLANWDERTFPTLQNVVNYEANSYYPNIPDQHVTPVLNEAQKKTWRGVQKVNFGQSINFNFNNGVAIGPEPEDEDVKAALAEEVKKP